MTDEPEIDIVITEHGFVRISPESLAWLESISPDWREILHNKRRRGKHAQAVREQVQRFEDAVRIAAEISRFHGMVLEEF